MSFHGFSSLAWRGGAPPALIADGDSPPVSGAYSVSADGSRCVVWPTGNADWWNKTFYSPLLCKRNGRHFSAPVNARAEVTLHTAFTLEGRNQFDQAGIFIRADDSTWLKCGIEYFDGLPRVSVVVTNQAFSDWSTQPWSDFVVDDDASAPPTCTTSLRLRVHKLYPGDEQGHAIVVEAAAYIDGDDAAAPGHFAMARVASLRPTAGPDEDEAAADFEMGIMSFAPIAAGCKASFHYFEIGALQPLAHESDGAAIELMMG
jgi:hypothetical protein